MSVKTIDYEQVQEIARDPGFNYLVIHGSGSREDDLPRQNVVQHLWESFLSIRNPIIVFDGYECRLKTIGETFDTDERLKSRRFKFPPDDQLIMRYAENTPEAMRELVKILLEGQSILETPGDRTLFVTGKNHAPRAAWIADHYWGDRKGEIYVHGVQTPADVFFKNWMYEQFAGVVTRLAFAGTTRGGDPDELTRVYRERTVDSGIARVARRIIRP